MVATFPLQGQVWIKRLQLFQKEDVGSQLQSEWNRERAQKPSSPSGVVAGKQQLNTQISAHSVCGGKKRTQTNKKK